MLIVWKHKKVNEADKGGHVIVCFYCMCLFWVLGGWGVKGGRGERIYGRKGDKWKYFQLQRFLENALWTEEKTKPALLFVSSFSYYNNIFLNSLIKMVSPFHCCFIVILYCGVGLVYAHLGWFYKNLLFFTNIDIE